MEQGQSISIVLVELLLGFLEKNIWPLIILTLAIVTRKSIANIAERLIKLSFSFGGATGAVEAASPANQNEKSPQIQAEPKDSSEQSHEASSIQKPETIEPAGWLSKVQEAFSEQDNALATQILEGIQRNENNPDKRFDNENIFQYFSFTTGNNTTALQKLEELNKNSTNDHQLKESSSWLSVIYNEIKDYQKSKNLWESAISRCKSEEDKTNYIINLSDTHKNIDDIKTARELLEYRLTETTDRYQKSSLYIALARHLKEQGDIRGQSLALEKSVEYSPGNREILFDAAYAQSNDHLNLLAISNYSTLIDIDPNNATALNNLGVCAGALNVEGKQVEYYKKSKNKGYTLAMANLASLYMDSGFFDEAEDILTEAIKSDDPHENAGNAFYKLKNKKTATNETWSNYLKKSKDFQRRIRAYGEAYFDCKLPHLNIPGVWKTEAGDNVHITISENLINGKWSTTEHFFGSETHFNNTFSGKIKNRSASIIYKKNQTPPRPSTLLGLSPNRNLECLIYLTPDNNELHIFSFDKDQTINITLSRQHGDAEENQTLANH